MIPILLYHNVSGDPGDTGGDPVYTCSRVQFEQQMAYLSDQGFRALRLCELLKMDPAARASSRKHVVITFDDGLQSQGAVALPILRKFGFTAEFFFTVDWIGRADYLGWDEIREMAREGMGIGSHSVHHRFFDDLPHEEASLELTESKRVLEREVGQAVEFFAAPGGRLHSTTAQHARQAGYAGICTSAPGWVAGGLDPFAMPRISIKSSTTQEIFRRIILCDPVFFRQLSWQAGVLQAAKRIMGNAWYERVRSAWFRVIG